MSNSSTNIKDLWPSTIHGQWMSEKFEQGLVSVIVPTYNRAGMITDAMDSVFAQTFRPIELIVVDDGSTDSTAEVIKQWGEQHADDSQFELRFFGQQNRGAPVARNRGLIESRGEFIQFLDSDDVLLTEKINLAIKKFVENPQFDLVYSLWEFEDADGNRSRPQSLPDLVINPTAAEIVTANLWTPSPLYRREIISEAGPWDERLLCSQERELNSRIMIRAKFVDFIDLPGAVMRRHKSNRIGKAVHKNYELSWISSRKTSCESIFKALVFERSQNKYAYKIIADRYISCVRGMYIAGSSGRARRLLLQNTRIWRKGGFTACIKASLWLIASTCPSSILKPLLNLILRIKG